MASNAPAPEARHAYNPGVQVKISESGRRYLLCRCGSPRHAPSHRGMQPLSHPPLAATDRHPFRAKLAAVKVDARGAHQLVCATCGKPPQSTRHRQDIARPNGGPLSDQPGPVPATPTPAPLSHNHGYPLVSPERHAFVLSGRTDPDRRGRLHQLCATCDRHQNSPRHRVGPRPDPVATVPAAVSPHSSPVVATGPTRAIAGRSIKAPAAELALLAIAIDQLLALPGDAISWRLRVQLGSLRSSVPVPMLPTLRPDEQLDPENGPAPTEVEVVANPRLAPSHPIEVGTSVLRGISNDRVRTLAKRAIEDGWTAAKTGSGHLSLSRGDRRVILSMTNSSRGGHWWQNVRAEARRAGINVVGL